MAQKSRLRRGTPGARSADTVSCLRPKLSALVVIAAILAAAGAPLLAAPAHPACASRDHGCGRAATLAKCCCGEQGPASDQGAPIQTRVQVAVDLAAVPALVAAPVMSDAAERIVRPRAFPPGATPPDLVTLFATLLI